MTRTAYVVLSTRVAPAPSLYTPLTH